MYSLPWDGVRDGPGAFLVPLVSGIHHGRLLITLLYMMQEPSD